MPFRDMAFRNEDDLKRKEENERRRSLKGD